MRKLHPQPLDLLEPEDITWKWLKPDSFELSSSPFFFASDQVKLPFLADIIPDERGSSANAPSESREKEAGGVINKIFDWFK
ncbi:MAG: hypothetical protein P8130_12155 [Deltaproteobacteria bacterium]